ncbi:hypothetical protein [Ferrimonas gelatinilytica]|uniref:Glycine-rich domain-containing protein-like n=1 Tax=Ferrimonas gelatinilytica TaxID=1255257 RepID=A0ABP9RZL2_9GAMM
MTLAAKNERQFGELEPLVSTLDFARLKYKYTETSEAMMTPLQWDAAQLEYQRFLTLKMLYPLAALVPSKQVDEIWHAHILDTRAYRDDCEKLFGRFVDHYPYFGIYGKDDQKALQDAFEHTVELYEREFGQYPQPQRDAAARCQDHACHVPTSCACRTPEACK